MHETRELPLYMQLKLKHAQEDIAAKISGPYLERVLAYELVNVKRMFGEVEREQSLQLARETLSYVQDVLYKADNIPPLRYGRAGRR